LERCRPFEAFLYEWRRMSGGGQFLLVEPPLVACALRWEASGKDRPATFGAVGDARVADAGAGKQWVWLADRSGHDATVEAARHERRPELERRGAVLVLPGLLGDVEDLVQKCSGVAVVAPESRELDRTPSRSDANNGATMGDLV